MTLIYLSGATSNATHMRRLVDVWDWGGRPMPVLLSFAYRAGIDEAFKILAPRRAMLDSGAYTASTRGVDIDLAALTAEAAKPRWSEVVSLDVIGDWRASKRNAELMTEVVGDRVMPVFHIGEPWEVLVDYAARWRKVGIGGLVGSTVKVICSFLDQVLARVWPKKLHVFGVSSDAVLQRFPLHSCDSATWLLASTVQRRGLVDGQSVPLTGATLTHGIATWLADAERRQSRARDRWQRELTLLEGS